MTSVFSVAGRLAAAAIVLAAWLSLPSDLSAQTAAGTSARAIPPNAHGDGFGGRWECDKGFRKTGDACVAMTAPANAFTTDVTYGKGWECKRGFVDKNETCVAVIVPPNAFLSAYGDTWHCARTFQRMDDKCVAIKVPKNGYLTRSDLGTGWECERGYRAVDGACVAVVAWFCIAVRARRYMSG